MLGDGHAGFGGRAGETHREQSRQGAPVRPNNLAEAVEKTVVRHRALLREPGHKATPMAPPTDRAELEEKSLAEPRTSGRLSDRVRRQHATVHQLLGKGMALRAIACELRLSRTTVRRLAHATTQTSCWSVNGRAAPASWTPTSPTSTSAGPRDARTPPVSSANSKSAATAVASPSSANTSGGSEMSSRTTTRPARIRPCAT